MASGAPRSTTRSTRRPASCRGTDWVHRDMIYWKTPRDPNSHVWHFVFLNYYTYYLSREEGKRYAKNKGKSKN
eukprot:2777481-Pyramimonas_sp.AAC.1